ncbi:50S ribosomal protein L25/general stress protein Ctc [Azovibrio restrictus]|uniref:50S ribosomal protein L25/general stress protein Ctc n=1 Tax=Azovibrio restrictus TaxID=146938 RepID=UPI00042745D9|nr:50S ribosomal protein L25/general stress protein Ctc [Azovibrio restrictus]
MQFVLNAQKRTLQGSSASRRLRRAGKVPGIIYGAGQAPEVVEFDHNQLYQGLRKEAFHSSVLTIEVEGQKQQVLLRDFQVHAYRPLCLHVDFQRVDANQKLHQKVPLHFVNQDQAPGVKLGGGQVAHVLSELEISCLPADLPEFIEVDLKDMKAGESIHVSQLKLPKGVTAVVHGDDQAVVSCIAKKGGAAAAEGEEAAA